MEANHPSFDVAEVLNDPRVVRIFELALRDYHIRRRYVHLRKAMTVAEATERVGDEFSLSDEHIRSIIYRKKE